MRIMAQGLCGSCDAFCNPIVLAKERERGGNPLLLFFFVFLYPRRIFCGGQYDAWWDAMTGPQDNGQRTSNDGRLETHNKAQKGAKQFALCHRSDRKPDRPEMKLIRINYRADKR